MLHRLAQNGDPWMFAMFVDGKDGPREIRVGEGAHRHGRHARPALDDIGDGGAAVGTEAVFDAMTAVRHAGPDLGPARDAHLVIRPAGLDRKGRTRALL